MRIQNWNVYLATSGGCQRENTAARVSSTHVMPHDADCHLCLSGKEWCKQLSRALPFELLVSKHLNACPNICRRPIAIPDFMQHFWWCFDKLKEYAHLHPGMPAYFRFMTILGEEDTLVNVPAVVSCGVCNGHVVTCCLMLPCFSVKVPDNCTMGHTVNVAHTLFSTPWLVMLHDAVRKIVQEAQLDL